MKRLVFSVNEFMKLGRERGSQAPQRSGTGNRGLSVTKNHNPEQQDFVITAGFIEGFFQDAEKMKSSCLLCNQIQ